MAKFKVTGIPTVTFFRVFSVEASCAEEALSILNNRLKAIENDDEAIKEFMNSAESFSSIETWDGKTVFTVEPSPALAPTNPKYLELVKTGPPSALTRIPINDRTEEICLAAVKRDGSLLRFVPIQTQAICLAAVDQNGYALQYVKGQTVIICLTAISQNPFALKFVEDQEEAICLAAVRQYGYALQFVKNQTEEICLAAVRRHGLALQYVKEQTVEICFEAVKENKYAIQYVSPNLFLALAQGDI